MNRQTNLHKKMYHWFEPIGLVLLLLSFGWQCLDEHTNQMKVESYMYETNEKLLYVWMGIYDEALHSNRYRGKAVVSVNYDSLNEYIKDWGEVKNEMATLDSQANLFFRIRVVLYVIGSIFIILAKWPTPKERI